MGQNTKHFPAQLTANGTSADEWSYTGTKGAIHASGTFGSGTLTLEISLNGGVTFKADANFSLTAEDIVYFSAEAPYGALYRFVLTGATAPALDLVMLQNSKL